jgi:hypothetical protein
MATYLKVFWRHDFDEEPVALYSEIVGGLEIRKIELFSDGHADYADMSTSTGSTQLSESQMPTTSEIAIDPQFEVHEISGMEFEAAWESATNSRAD